MPDFRYTAARRSGGNVSGLITAPTRAQAVRMLRDDGLYPMDVQESSGSSRTFSLPSLTAPLLRRVPRDSVASTMRQLATLLNAGIPLDKSLDAVIVAEKRRTELQRILTEVRDAVRGGSELAAAFGRFPRVFGTTFVTMVRAGENSGSLGIVMDRLADHMEQQLAMRRKVQAALAYPILMLVVGICVVTFLLTFVVPKVTQIFIDMKHELPLPTRILMGLSDVIRDHGLLILLAVLLTVLAIHRFIRTERGKRLRDRIFIKLPVIGSILRLLSVSRFTKTLGMLYKNGVSLVNSLTIVRNVADNTLMQDVVDQVHHDVVEGKPLTGPLADSGIFEHAAVQMISAGEQTGRLAEMLLVVADDSDTKVNAKLQLLASLMEPLMILALGGMVGFVVLAIMLPIFEMSSLVGG